MANEKRLDLIDRNALMDSHWWNGMKDPFDKARAKIIIQSAKTVDAVEVVHGRWKYYHKQNIAVCTNCSFERDLSANFGKAISCPNCGAHMMDGGNEDGSAQA